MVYDVLKVRTLVDEATTAAVRAASFEGSALDAVGGGHSGSNSRLSKERKLRMREQAAQKLALAYRTDEIACSVASMQGTSTLEDIGGAVLQRNPGSGDAKYVDFFHEKIPSRHVAETTTVEPLLRILDGGSTGSGSGSGGRHFDGRAEVLRTCATVRVFLDDLEGAARDLTEALAETKHRSQLLHAEGKADAGSDSSRGQEVEKRTARRMPDAPLPESERPSGLEGQLLFNRACVYLSMACKSVPGCFPTDSKPTANGTTTYATNTTSADTSTPPTPETTNADTETDTDTHQTEKRRLVKTYAKRAIRDLSAFLDGLHYSPNLPLQAARDFNLCVEAATLRKKTPRYTESDSSSTSYTVYTISQLFAAVPPSDLPPFPPAEAATAASTSTETCEFVTFHPLLEEALHQLLMAHCLAQTSTRELQRHAHMAARLVRLADAYPIFQLNHCAARVDWVEIIRLCGSNNSNSNTNSSIIPDDDNASWDSLCEPPRWRSAAQRMAEVAMAGTRPNVKLAAQIRRLKYEDAQAERASAANALLAADEDGGAAAAGGGGDEEGGGGKGWGDVMGRDLTPVTERAGLVARWVLEVPVVTGVVRRKKPKKGKKT